MSAKRDRAAEERERRASLKLAGEVRRPLKATHKPLAALLPPAVPGVAPLMSNEVVKVLVGKKGSEAVVDASGAQLDSDAWLAMAPDQIAECARPGPPSPRPAPRSLAFF